MKTRAGLWIDHRKAVIVMLSDQGEETTLLKSNVEKQPGRVDGQRSTLPYEAQMVSADDRLERKFTGQLRTYYDEVISVIREAGSILIFGPGEAKDELKKHLEKNGFGEHIKAVETVDSMTDRQVEAKVREYFKK